MNIAVVRTANIANISILNALSIGGSLVVADWLCIKRDEK